MAFIEIGAGRVFIGIAHLLFGLLILLFPNFLRYLVGLYFLLIGILLLF